MGSELTPLPIWAKNGHFDVGLTRKPRDNEAFRGAAKLVAMLGLWIIVRAICNYALDSAATNGHIKKVVKYFLIEDVGLTIEYVRAKEVVEFLVVQITNNSRNPPG